MRLTAACLLIVAFAFTFIAADEPKMLDPAKASADERAILDATNEERKAADLLPLKPSPKLTAMAREHSATMARLMKLGHDLDGTTFADRLKASGYPFAAAGENVAEGQKMPAEAVAAWMDSPPHKKNLLSEDFTEIGVAVAAADDGTRYWTQVFAKPRGE